MNDLDGRIKGRVVLAGVGCLGRGDDAFGPLLVRRLAGVDRLSVLDCGDRLEDFTGDIALGEPGTVLIADAVDMGAAPGNVALLEPEQLSPGTGDTHRASLRAVMEYLRLRTGATVLLLGIQPGRIADTCELSPQVASALDHLEKILRGDPRREGPGRVTRAVQDHRRFAAGPSNADPEPGSEPVFDFCQGEMPDTISIPFPAPMMAALPPPCSVRKNPDISLAGEEHEP